MGRIKPSPSRVSSEGGDEDWLEEIIKCTPPSHILSEEEDGAPRDTLALAAVDIVVSVGCGWQLLLSSLLASVVATLAAAVVVLLVGVGSCCCCHPHLWYWQQLLS